MRELAERAEALCREIVPADLDGLGIYVVLQSELPAELGVNDGPAGFTSASLDMALKDLLADRWTGRGACVVINDKHIAALPAMVQETHFFATALHELSHVIDVYLPYIRNTAADDGHVQLSKAMFATNAKQVDELFVDPEVDCFRRLALTSFSIHGRRFIRCAMHLRRRAEIATGKRIPANLVMLWAPLSSPFAYEAAVGDEVDSLRSLSITEILDGPEPARFAALYAEDEETFLRDYFPQEMEEPEMSIAPNTKEKVEMSLLDQVMNVLSEIGDIFTGEKLSIASTFDELAVAIADNPKKVDRKKANAILKDCGKTPEELVVAVKTILHRRELQERILHREEMQAERVELGQKIEAIAQELQAAQQRHDQLAEPLLLRDQELRHAINALGYLDAELQRTAPADSQAALSTANSEFAATQHRRFLIGQRLMERRENLGTLQKRVTQVLEKAAGALTDRTDTYADAIKKAEADVVAERQAIIDDERALAEIDLRVEAAEQRVNEAKAHQLVA